MKKIQNLIDSKRVFLNVDATDLVSGLTEIAMRLAELTGMETAVLLKSLEERERLGSTSVGGGFAIPHAKMKGLEDIVVILMRFAEAISFGPKAEVQMVAAVISPPDQPAAHLQVLSQIARLLKRDDFRRQLLESPNVDDVVQIVRDTAAREGL